MTAAQLQADLSLAFQEKRVNWYAVECEMRKESVCAVELSCLDGVSVWVPTYTTKGLVDRKRRAVGLIQHLALPGWLLVEMDPTANWSEVLDNKHVGEPLSLAGGEPGDYHKIPAEQIDILKQMERTNFGKGSKSDPSSAFEVGQKIWHVIAGRDVQGPVTEVRRDELTAEFPMMGRKVPVTIKLSDIEAA